MLEENEIFQFPKAKQAKLEKTITKANKTFTDIIKSVCHISLCKINTHISKININHNFKMHLRNKCGVSQTLPDMFLITKTSAHQISYFISFLQYFK